MSGVFGDQLHPASEDNVVHDRGPDGLQGRLVRCPVAFVTEVQISEEDAVATPPVVGDPGVLEDGPPVSLLRPGRLHCSVIPFTIYPCTAILFVLQFEIDDNVRDFTLEEGDGVRDAAPDKRRDPDQLRPVYFALVCLVARVLPGRDHLGVSLGYHQDVRN